MLMLRQVFVVAGNPLRSLPSIEPPTSTPSSTRHTALVSPSQPYCCGTMRISTRRFAAFPEELEFEAIGLDSP